VMTSGPRWPAMFPFVPETNDIKAKASRRSDVGTAAKDSSHPSVGHTAPAGGWTDPKWMVLPYGGMGEVSMANRASIAVLVKREPAPTREHHGRVDAIGPPPLPHQPGALQDEQEVVPVVDLSPDGAHRASATSHARRDICGQSSRRPRPSPPQSAGGLVHPASDQRTIHERD
jgi:hypothetical protein